MMCWRTNNFLKSSRVQAYAWISWAILLTNLLAKSTILPMLQDYHKIVTTVNRFLHGLSGADVL